MADHLNSLGTRTVCSADWFLHCARGVSRGCFWFTIRATLLAYKTAALPWKFDQNALPKQRRNTEPVSRATSK